MCWHFLQRSQVHSLAPPSSELLLVTSSLAGVGDGLISILFWPSGVPVLVHTNKSSLYFLISLSEYYTVSGFISHKIFSLNPSLFFENDLLKKNQMRVELFSP